MRKSYPRKGAGMNNNQSEALRWANILTLNVGSQLINRKQAAAELRRLHQCCRDVYEVWAGSEGVPEPQTAVEAYLLSLVEQMRDAAKEGLK